MTTQPTERILTDPQFRCGITIRELCDRIEREALASVPADVRDLQGQPRPADQRAYPTGWLDPLGTLYRCHGLADEHNRVALVWGPVRFPAAAGDWPAVLERAGWRRLRSDGTLSAGPVTLAQLVYLMSLEADWGPDLEPAYRDGLVRTVCCLAGRPLAPGAPLPQRLPLPPLPDAGEVAQERGEVAGWLAPDGRLYPCLRHGHGRFAAVLAHALGVTQPASLDAWRRLERAGWAHLGDGGSLECSGELTQAQLDTLGDLLADERLPAGYRGQLVQWIAPHSRGGAVL
jgi:hypothetical protein